MQLDNVRLRWKTFLALSVLFTIVLYISTFAGQSIDRNQLRPGVHVLDEQWIEYDATVPHYAPTKAALPGAFPRPVYVPSTVDPQNHNISRTLVIAKKAEEDTTWVSTLLPSSPLLTTTIYTVDDALAANTVPQNKGHEVMVYLTYIIDHYTSLSDITMFMHAHLTSWHNNDLLDSSAAEMVLRLRAPHVLHNGYMNMRCHLDPGCPAHIHPLTDGQDPTRPEAVILAKAWTELFPGQSIPAVLSQPCCAQLAVSRERIHALPVEQYVFFRGWLLRVDLDDQLSGRVFEYAWQYIWAGEYEVCPAEHVCYCDGYGVCFGGEEEYRLYFALRREAREIHAQIDNVDADVLNEEDRHYWEFLRLRLARLDQQMRLMKDAAFERGMDPRSRALEAGRPWSEGNGF